jgi:two-component sensor histidine kinase
LVVSDNGLGIPENIDWRNTETLGLQLVKILAEDQLDGTISLTKDIGTLFTIRFNLKF